MAKEPGIRDLHIPLHVAVIIRHIVRNTCPTDI